MYGNTTRWVAKAFFYIKMKKVKKSLILLFFSSNLLATPGLHREEMVPLNFSAEGFPKLKKYYLDPPKNTLPSKYEFDFNGDGRVDFTQFFSSDGKWVQQELSDMDGDGVAELSAYYQRDTEKKVSSLVKQELDTSASGKPNVWKYFEKNKLIRREIDRNGAGRPDYWEYYENERLVKVDRDEDKDGNPDKIPEIQKLIVPKSKKPDTIKRPVWILEGF